jgi:DNA-binding NtrC family response regulator
VILAETDTLSARHLNLSFSASLAPAEAAPADPWDQIDLSGSLAEVSRRILREAEQRKIKSTLAEASGDKGRTAEMLQVPYKFLMTKLREHGIT